MSNLFYRNYSYRMKKNNIFKNYLYYYGFLGIIISNTKIETNNLVSLLKKSNFDIKFVV